MPRNPRTPLVAGLVAVAAWLAPAAEAQTDPTEISGCITRKGKPERVAFGDAPSSPCGILETPFTYQLRPPSGASCKYYDVWYLDPARYTLGGDYPTLPQTYPGLSLTAVLALKWEGFDEKGPVSITWDADFPWFVDEWALTDRSWGSVLFLPERAWLGNLSTLSSDLSWYRYSGNYGPTGATVQLDAVSGTAVFELPMGTQWIKLFFRWPDEPDGPREPLIQKLRMTALDSGQTATCTFDTDWLMN